MGVFKLTAEQKAFRLQRLREAMAKPRSDKWLANQRAGVRRAALLGKFSHKQSAETIEKRVSKFRGKKRPPEVVAKIAAANRGKNLFHKVSAETRAKLSAAGKAHWAQKRPASERERIRQFGLSHRGKKHELIQNQIHSAKMWGHKWEPETVEKRAAPMRGRPQRAEATKKGPTNVNSISGVLRSRENVLYPFVNLTHFVREHPELFDPADLIIRPNGKRRVCCNAQKRLLALFGKGKVVPGS